MTTGFATRGAVEPATLAMRPPIFFVLQTDFRNGTLSIEAHSYELGPVANIDCAGEFVGYMILYAQTNGLTLSRVVMSQGSADIQVGAR